MGQVSSILFPKGPNPESFPLEVLVAYLDKKNSVEWGPLQTMASDIYELLGKPRASEISPELDHIPLPDLIESVSDRLDHWNTCLVGEGSSLKTHWEKAYGPGMGPGTDETKSYLLGKGLTEIQAQKTVELGLHANNFVNDSEEFEDNSHDGEEEEEA